MRPISLSATVVLRLADVLPYLVWLLVAFGLFRAGAAFNFPFFVSIPASLLATVTTVFALRPVRRAIHIGICKVMARSSIRCVMEAGVWSLLKVAHRYWAGDPVTDFVGLAALHESYDRVPEKRRLKILGAVSQMQGTQSVSVGARDFLDEVERE